MNFFKTNFGRILLYLYPDPHFLEGLDPDRDPHFLDADPKQWYLYMFIYNFLIDFNLYSIKTKYASMFIVHAAANISWRLISNDNLYSIIEWYTS